MHQERWQNGEALPSPADRKNKRAEEQQTQMQIVKGKGTRDQQWFHQAPRDLVGIRGLQWK